MKLLLILLANVLLLSGCLTTQQAMPDAGKAVYTESTSAEGIVTKSLQITAPQQGDGSTSAKVGDVEITLSSSFEWEMPEIPNATPQNMMYGVGLACIVIAALLIGIGKHFKLGGIAGATGAGIIAMAVTIDKLGSQIALLGGLLLLIGGTFIGWMMWKDYKDDGKLNLSAKP